MVLKDVGNNLFQEDKNQTNSILHQTDWHQDRQTVKGYADEDNLSKIYEPFSRIPGRIHYECVRGEGSSQACPVI